MQSYFLRQALRSQRIYADKPDGVNTVTLALNDAQIAVVLSGDEYEGVTTADKYKGEKVFIVRDVDGFTMHRRYGAMDVSVTAGRLVERLQINDQFPIGITWKANVTDEVYTVNVYGLVTGKTFVEEIMNGGETNYHMIGPVGSTKDHKELAVKLSSYETITVRECVRQDNTVTLTLSACTMVYTLGTGVIAIPRINKE